MHDRFGNVIAESNGTGPSGTLREYIWLPEAEIAPTLKSRAQVDRPLAVVEDVLTGTPVTWLVHVDHLNRPVRMTDAGKVVVWDAVWTPWGLPHAITGTGATNQRFPGQWFQLEAGLHYNWHRHYDPSLGRYTQPDPLGFVDGPSVYGYGRASPLVYVDPDGRFIIYGGPQGAAIGGAGPSFVTGGAINIRDFTSNTFWSLGGGVGLDAGGGLGVGVFFGDWCEFEGDSFNVNLSFFGFGGSLTITPGGSFGVGLGYTRGPSWLPVGVSATYLNTRLNTGSGQCKPRVSRACR